MDIDRVIGKLEEQARYSDIRFNSIETKVDALLADQWKRKGASWVITGIISIIVTLLVEFARAKG